MRRHRGQRGRTLHLGGAIEWSHPTNVGLVEEWAVVPRVTGGTRLLGLARRNHGTLTNGPTWVGARGRPGGYGALSLTGETQHVVCGTTINPSAQPIALAGWCRSTSTGRPEFLVNKNFGSSVVPYSLSLGGTPGGGVIDGFAFFDGSHWRKSGITTDVRGDGKWHFVAGTWDGTTASFYLDGRLDASAAPGGTRPTTGSGQTAIGAYLNDSAYFIGELDELTIFDRCLSAGQVAHVYHESSDGNPERWRWVGGRTWFLPEETAAAGALLRHPGMSGLGGRFHPGYSGGLVA
jgi:hypothetical protein